MGETYDKITEKLLDMHIEIINRTHEVGGVMPTVEFLEKIDFISIIYHDSYDVWRASNLSYEYYYNILVSLEKYVCKIWFENLYMTNERYKYMWSVLDDLIVFLEEEYDNFNIHSILGDLETAADVFSAALVIPVNNIYTRLVEMRQVLNIKYQDNPMKDSTFSLNMDGYLEMNIIPSLNKVKITVLTYRRPTGYGTEGNLFVIPNMDHEEPGFDDVVAKLGGAYKKSTVKRMLQTRGRYLVRDTLVKILLHEDIMENDSFLDCENILEHIYSTLFILLVIKGLPIEQIVSNLLKHIQFIRNFEFVSGWIREQSRISVVHIIYLSNELRLKCPGIACIDALLNYARLLHLVGLRVMSPGEDITSQDRCHYITREQSTATKLEKYNTMDVQRYDTLKQVVVSLGRKNCSFCNTTHFVKKFVLCVNCPHLLCFTCLHYWINKSCTFTCPVCRVLMPKLYFDQDFKALKEILETGGRQSAEIAEEFYETLSMISL